MADLIITNAVIVTVDPDRRVISDGAIAIKGDRIIDIGTADEIAARHTAGEIIDGAGMAVIPGLIDVHAHAGHGLIKTMASGNSAEWYNACLQAYTVGSTPEFWRAEAQLAALERVRFGVTTGVSLLGGGDSIMRTDEAAYGDAHCDGVLEVGTRSVVAVGTTRPPHPLTYGRWSDMEQEQFPIEFDQQLQTSTALIDRWHGTHGRRINIALLTPTLRAEHVDTLGAENIERAREQAKIVRQLSRDRGLVFTQDGHKRGSVAYAHELGLLGPDALLSHSTGLTEEEIRICADTDTRIAHNPSAIASVYDRCPATELMEAGVIVALGSDATAPDRSGDMFRHMQQAMHYHRTFHKDPSWLPPGKTLEMCTIDGATALGMADDLGSIEVGKKADLTLVDLRRPHLYPANMPVSRIVCFANGNDVHTVIVDGKILMRDRKVTTVDEDKVLDAAQRETDLMLKRTGLEHLLDTPDTFWRSLRMNADA
ncbi:amidohydrolase family protein [Devosia sp. 1566]|uniref:amidohydrolase family protein n=1 Tax=Devosia sp. 1566 TaxID=2499144 RepID=UPI000FD8CE08|nr:amidohydrolase family protein [Devosia sp. 1566]